MSDRWLKPDFQEICVSGECTAYAGTQDVREIRASDNEKDEREALATASPPSLTLPAR